MKRFCRETLEEINSCFDKNCHLVLLSTEAKKHLENCNSCSMFLNNYPNFIKGLQDVIHSGLTKENIIKENLNKIGFKFKYFAAAALIFISVLTASVLFFLIKQNTLPQNEETKDFVSFIVDGGEEETSSLYYWPYQN